MIMLLFAFSARSGKQPQYFCNQIIWSFTRIEVDDYVHTIIRTSSKIAKSTKSLQLLYQSNWQMD